MDDEAGSRFLERLTETLRPLGLDHFGVIPAERYDAEAPPAVSSGRLLPDARSVLIVASGGPVFFRNFVADAALDPSGRLGCANPLDDFTARTFAALEPLFAEEGAAFRRFSPAVGATPALDFVKLGRLAGLGAPSELGLLVHPRFGPWLAFRQAVFTTRALPPSEPLATRSCDGCPAPCRAACPIVIVGPGPFDWDACARQHVNEPCASRCDARLACVVAPHMRYDPVEMLYHAAPERGRAALLRR